MQCTVCTDRAVYSMYTLSSAQYVHTQSSVQYVHTEQCTVCKKVKKNAKEADLYSASIEVPYTQGTQVRITQCYLQITPYLPLPRKHSPDGASPD